MIEKRKSDLATKGVKYCVDLHGVPKGKVVPLSHFDHFAQGSELSAGYAPDGLGQGPNEDEINSVSDLERGMILPWSHEVGWFPADNEFKGGPMRSMRGSQRAWLA